MAYVAAAGPVANVVVALILAGAFRALDLAGLGEVGRELLYLAVVINLLLAILNLIPIPPLDGFAVVTALVPPSLGVRHPGTRATASCSSLLLFIVPNSPLSAVRAWPTRGRGLCGSERRTDAADRAPVPRPPVRPGLA